MDFLLTERRDIAAAKGFFAQAGQSAGRHRRSRSMVMPLRISQLTTSKKRASCPNLVVRMNRYLNNQIEQDHRRVKQRVRPILGFKHFAYAAITISGIELIHQIKKGQYDVSGVSSSQTRTPQIWEAVLAA